MVGLGSLLIQRLSDVFARGTLRVVIGSAIMRPNYGGLLILEEVVSGSPAAGFAFWWLANHLSRDAAFYRAQPAVFL